MKSLRNCFSVLFCFVLVSSLTACGGGGSSDGAGGDSNFDITPYVGEWLTSLNAVVNFRGQTGVTNTTNLIIIDSQGKFIDPDSDPQCPGGLEGQIINSNLFNWSATYNCTLDGIGLCQVNESGTLRLTGSDTATGEFTQNATCGANNEPLQIDTTFTAVKQS